jgi:light-regulated signal transduction histidine kinase (bacteriophytochrome)
VPDRLGRAVNNVLDNAAAFSPPGGMVEVALRDGVLEVRDHGPGAPDEELAQLFDRFFRGAQRRARPGSGLGLPSCGRSPRRTERRSTPPTPRAAGSSFGSRSRCPSPRRAARLFGLPNYRSRDRWPVW